MGLSVSGTDTTIQTDPQYLVPDMDYIIVVPVIVPDSVNITWLLNNSTTAINSTNDTIITVSSFNPNNDTGIYMMVASNEVFSTILYVLDIREAGMCVSLEVLTFSDILVLNPFTIVPQNITAPLGNMATFKCEAADSYPTPSITWFNANDDEIVDEPGDRLHLSPIGTLYIQNVAAEDAGQYTCQASNIAGMNTTSAWLTIEDKPVNCKCHSR